MPVYVVVDTNVWVQCFLAYLNIENDSDCLQVLYAYFDGRFVPVYSSEMLIELEHVLKWKKLKEFPTRFTPALVDEFIEDVVKADNHRFRISGTVHVCKDDPDDDVFIETAAVAAVPYLVTRNRTHFQDNPAVVNYLRAHGVEILYPDEFLALLPDAEPDTQAEPEPV